MASVGLMHNLSKMMVILGSAGDARLSWKCQLSAIACIQDMLRIPVYIKTRIYLYLEYKASSNQYFNNGRNVFYGVTAHDWETNCPQAVFIDPDDLS